ncbi:hypothetical protein NPX13_g4047 [Xylaria arbuscula]|uniref:RNase H type-1 domain-containing protein n=1 Tax=Xylaria arbuscula TaxID=114810 RepID=A0A9W8TNQ2_9PEZI|nr:hypothetical protein NPX13_g4047 [Xylaria arbuscula]
MCGPWRMFALAALGYDTSRVKDNHDGFLSELKSGQSLMQFSRVTMETESTRQSWQRFAPLVPMTLLRKFRSRLATDPRDKVFTVLGLIRSWGTKKSGEAMKGITPDYSTHDYWLFFDTAILLIRNTRSLGVLAGTLQGGDGRSRMPSWITDWNCPPTVDEHTRLGNIQLYSAADYLSGSVAVHGHSILEVQGYPLDKVDHVGRVLENNQGTSRSRLTVREWQKALPKLSEAVAKSYIAGGSLYATSNYVREFQRLPEEMEPRSEAFEHWLTVDKHSHRRTSLIGGTDPPDMRIGDSVAVLLGSRVPFILREDGRPRRCSGQDINVLFSERASYQAGKGAKARADEEFHCYVTHQHCYHVVGDAYVHGMMRGDVKRTNQWNDAPIYLLSESINSQERGDAEQAESDHQRELESGRSTLLICTDGSGIDGHTGAAAVCPRIRQTRKAYMGRDTVSTVYAGELQGINIALEIAREDLHRGSRRDKAIIYTDNQTAIRSSATPVGKSGAYILISLTSGKSA